MTMLLSVAPDRALLTKPSNVHLLASLNGVPWVHCRVGEARRIQIPYVHLRIGLLHIEKLKTLAFCWIMHAKDSENGAVFEKAVGSHAPGT